jgi:integrase
MHAVSSPSPICAVLDGFVRDRRAGRLSVPGYDLRSHPTDRTIGADLEFLRRVFNWGATIIRRDGSPLVERNPLTRYPIPSNPNPKRPVATYDRYVAVRAKAEEADPQGLFGSFLDLIEGLGWRVSAVCQLQAADLDMTVNNTVPFGRILKREANDKERVEMWVPMSGNVRAAVLTALEKNPVAGTAPLFPAPRSLSGEPWTRYHARGLLERAEKLAGLEPLDGSDFHAYRRAWATSRKHLPLADVAQAGGWKRTETLLRCYQRPDDATLFAVVSEPRKVRSITGKP